MSQFRRAGGAIATSAPISERQYQSMMERRRQEDNRLSDLAQYHQQSALMKAANNSNMKVDTLRRQRRAQEQYSEIERDLHMEASIRDAEQKKILRQQEEALQEAMAKIEQTKLSEEMNVRRVCAQSDELKELKSLLNAARLNKERATQLVETQVSKQQETLADKEYAAKIDADRQKAELDEAVAMQSAYEHKIFARKALQEQMVEREQDKLRLIEESRKEKERIDAVVADIIESDRQKMEAVKRKQAELQGDIKSYLSQRAIWRQQEAERTKQELRKIQEYQEQQEQRQSELMQKRKQRDGQQDALLQAIAADLARKRAEAEEKQMLLMELYEEEREQRMEEEARIRDQRRAEFALQVRAANDQLLAFREARQKEQQLEEAEYRRQLMSQFEQDRKMEQLSADRRRREMASYRAEVEKLVEERKRSMASQLEKEIAERQSAQDKEFQRRQIVEEERAKLLREHAADLSDFLPKGVFRSSEEYERVMGRLPDRNEQPSHGLGPRKFKI